MVNQPIRIAIDAMGGDYAPKEIVRGAVCGARKYGVSVLLVGHPEAIEPELSALDVSGLSIEIVPATEAVEMGESPMTALRKKRNASIVVTAKCVAQGKAQAMVAAGSTGAAMASALLNIGRIDGVERPAIGVLLPALKAPTLLLDVGANADCDPGLLQQFARMGSVFMASVHQRPTPRVGLLNNGSEPGKGNELMQETFTRLSGDAQLNFIGNVEGRDLFNDQVDVAVCDGFTGNVVLKSIEGIVLLMLQSMRGEFTRDLRTKTGAMLVKPALKKVKKLVDPEEFGGALLLGIDGICVISHGGSHALAIENAIRVAKEAVEVDVIGKIGDKIRQGCEVATA